MTKRIMIQFDQPTPSHGAEGKQEVDVDRTGGGGWGATTAECWSWRRIGRQTSRVSHPLIQTERGPTHSTEPGQQASRPDRYIDEVYR